jgi:hypothetical protein
MAMSPRTVPLRRLLVSFLVSRAPLLCVGSFVLLMIKLSVVTNNALIPWLLVFFPWIAKDVAVAHQRWCEFRGFRAMGSVQALASRQFGSFVEHVGVLGTLVAVCATLSVSADAPSWLLVCVVPLWASLMYTTCFVRLAVLHGGGVDDGGGGVNGAPLSVCFGRPNGVFFALLNLVFQVLTRGVQPTFVAARLGGWVSHPWSIVFAPSWVLVFCGICLSGVLMSCVPVVHPGSCAELREHAMKLVFLVTAHLLACILCVMLSLTWLSDAVARGANAQTPLYVLVPLAALFLFFASLRAPLLAYINGYLAFLRGVQHQDNHAALVAATKNKAVLSVIAEKTWLLQTSTTLYTRLPGGAAAAAELDAEVAARSPPDSAMLLRGTAFEDVVGLALYACATSGRFKSTSISAATRAAMRRLAGQDTTGTAGAWSPPRDDGATTSPAAAASAAVATSTANGAVYSLMHPGGGGAGASPASADAHADMDGGFLAPPGGRSMDDDALYPSPSMTAYELIEFHRRNRDREMQRQRDEAAGVSQPATAAAAAAAAAASAALADECEVRDVETARRCPVPPRPSLVEAVSISMTTIGSGSSGDSAGSLRSLPDVGVDVPASVSVDMATGAANTRAVASAAASSTAAAAAAGHTSLTVPGDTSMDGCEAGLDSSGGGAGTRAEAAAVVAAVRRSASNASDHFGGPSLRPYDGPRYHTVPRNRTRSDDFHGMDGESSHSSTNRFLSLFNSAATAGAGAIEALRGYSFTGADVAGDADPEACIICFSRDTDSCLLECGHVIMCFPCAAMVAKQMPNACPLCRVPIRFVVRITTPPFRLSDGRTLAVSGEGYTVRTDVVAAFARATARRAPTRGHRQNRPQEPQPPRQPQSITT